MLSYNQKHLQIPTPSEHNWIEDHRDDYYLKDPDQWLDELPQPFRMIDKLIGHIIDNAWENIEKREAEREAENLKIKPPTREAIEEVQLPGNLNCFANIMDGKNIFAGMSEGVAILNQEDHTIKSLWKMEGVEIIALQDNVSEKVICSKFEISEGGDYAGLTLEGKGENWLEVYRLQKDNWAQELDQFEKLMTLNGQTGVYYVWKNPFDALQKLDDSNIIGTGQNHVISTQQWIEEKKIFEEMYESYLSKDTTEETEEKQSQATFHFINLGRILPVGLEQKTQAGIPNALCLWWNGSHILFHYVLKIPVGKEKIELEPKADIVWPNASPITCSTNGKETHALKRAAALNHVKNDASTPSLYDSNPSVSTWDMFLLIFTTGTIALFDFTGKDVLCHFILPFPYVTASPWEPVFAFDGDGNFLFIKVLLNVQLFQLLSVCMSMFLKAVPEDILRHALLSESDMQQLYGISTAAHHVP
ncbi:WD repeat-containing protein 93 [Hemiscyllium ocellatum]|uniref:WD repeat-containing protein 93 n=1 Tax=Hemiscyllium ocellatum TaxID=170820 RepID=UPI0029670BF5|nr:WD repeat-containing protein 93 [Hemiscyllium ocellatum]